MTILGKICLSGNPWKQQGQLQSSWLASQLRLYVQGNIQERSHRKDGYRFQFRYLYNFEGILNVLERYGKKLSGEDRAAALSRIRTLSDRLGQKAPFELLNKAQSLILERMDGDPMSAKALSVILHGLVKLELHKESELGQKVLIQLEDRKMLEQLDVINILNILQALKEGDLREQTLLANIAAEIRYRHLRNIDARGIAQVFIAYSKLRSPFEMLSNALENEVIKYKMGPDFQPFNISQIIQACGHLQRYNIEFINYLINEARNRDFEGFDAVMFGDMVHGLALLRHRDEELLQFVAQKLLSQWTIRSVRSISWIANSYQVLRVYHEPLVQRIAQVFEEQLELVRKPSTLCRFAQALASWNQITPQKYFQMMSHLQELYDRQFEFHQADWNSMYQTYLVLGIHSKLDISIPDENMSFIQTMVDKVKDVANSVRNLQASKSLQISLGLHSLGIQHEMNVVIEECNCEVAAKFSHPAQAALRKKGSVVVVVVKPSMYFRNQQDLLTGMSQFIIQSLEVSGYQVIALSETELLTNLEAEQIAQLIQSRMNLKNFGE